MTADQQQKTDEPGGGGQKAEDTPPEENFTVVTSDWNPPEEEGQQAAAGDEEAGAEQKAEAEGGEEAKAGDEKDAEGKGDAEAEEGEGSIPEGVAKRLAREKKARREAETRLKTVEDRLAELEEERKADEAEEAEGEALDPNDFETYEEYLEAKRAADDKRKSPRQKAKEKEGEDEKKGEAEQIDGIPVEEVRSATVSLREQVADVDEDFADKLTAEGNPLGISLTAPMLVALNDADDPVGMLRHLAENTELSHEIANMPPKRMERRLLKLELELARGEVAEAKKAEEGARKEAGTTGKKGSDAPDPFKPASGRHQGAMTPEKALAQGNYKEYERLRNEEEEAKLKSGW